MATTETASPTRLDGYRERRDHYYAHDPNSPLHEGQRAHFSGLRYFPERPDLVFELPLATDGPGIGDTVPLAVADGSHKEFVRAGRVTFEIGGVPTTLTVFKEPGRGRYFLPFRDGTAGIETYAVGRYLDPRARPDGTLLIDFNYAYNPYCAYNHDGWTCPIPPRENVVPVRIEAGERSYAAHE